MADGLIIRDALKRQWEREAYEREEFRFDHSREAKDAWSMRRDAAGGILLCPSNADYFCQGYDAALVALKAKENG